MIDIFITAFFFQEAWSLILDPDPTGQVNTDLDPNQTGQVVTDPNPDLQHCNEQFFQWCDSLLNRVYTVHYRVQWLFSWYNFLFFVV